MSINNRAIRFRVSLFVLCILLVLVVPHLMDSELPFVVNVLLTPAWMLGRLVGRFIPMGNIGTSEDPVYEATPIHLLVGLTLVFLNILLYPTVVYFLLAVTARFSRVNGRRQRDLQ